MSGRPPEDQPSVDDFEFILAEDLKQQQAQRPQAVPTDPANPRPRKKSLAERAKVTKKLSAMEALQLAEQQAAEEKARKEKAELARKLAEEAVQRVAAQKAKEAEERRREEEQAAEDEAEWARKMFGSSAGPQMPVAGKKAIPASALPEADRPKPPPEPEPEEAPTAAPVAEPRSRRSRTSSRSLLGHSRRSMPPEPVEPESLDADDPTPAPAPPRAPAPSHAPAPPPEPTVPGALESLPEGASVNRTYDTIPADRMSALMNSHHSRARNEGDLQLAMALGEVCRLLEVQPDRLSAARVGFGGEEWALWMDEGRLIGAFLPADLYLIGL